MNESDYERGSRAAWKAVLQQCLLHLGYLDGATRDNLSWVLEREEAIAQLRDVCGSFGDNDWPENLHLGDVIEKHLTRHLHLDDGKASTLLLRRMVNECNPVIASEAGGNLFCFFCEADMETDKAKHEPDCIWFLAKGLIGNE